MTPLRTLAAAVLTMFPVLSMPLSARSHGSCSEADVTPVEHAALFDYFTYNGHDAFYSTHRLETKNAFYNPILPGWYSDPSICRVGKDYYMVTSTFSYFPGIPVFHSRDLINWELKGHVLDRPEQLQLAGQSINNGGIYASDISYNPRTKTFYVVTTNVGTGNFFVTSKNPAGSWSDPVMLPDVGGIDPSLFFDDDGRAYIVHNDVPDGKPEYDGHRAIRIHEFDPQSGRTTGMSKVIIDKGVNPAEKPIWIEGPHLYKFGGRYWLMAAEGGTGDRHSEVIFSSASPFGPYKPAARNPILTQRDLSAGRADPVTCTGHADLVQTPQGDWWAVFLGCRPYKGQFENLGRETFLMPVRWDDDGTPFITAPQEPVPMLLTMPETSRGGSVTFGNLTFSDCFESKKLGMGWLTLRGPATDRYSLRDVPGCLLLRCSDDSLTGTGVPAYVGRRIQHHEFDCSVRMIFRPDTDTESAGLLLFKNENRHYSLCVARSGADNVVEVRRAGDKGVETIASAVLPPSQTDVSLRVVSRGLVFDFYYSVTPGEWLLLAEGIDAGCLSTRFAGGFTGTTIGMYASGV